MKRRNHTVAPEAFIVAWQAAKSFEDLWRTLGMKPATAQVRASKMRTMGVPLRKFVGGGRRKLDWAALAKLANGAGKKARA